MSDTITVESTAVESTAPMHRPGTRAKENSAEDAWLRQQIAQGVAALSEQERAQLAEIGARIRVVKAQIRMVNNVPAALLFVWPVFVFWLVPVAVAAQRVHGVAAYKPLVALAEDLYRPNWALPEAGTFVDDIVALRDQRALLWGAIFGPMFIYGGILFVALVLLRK